MPIIIWGFYILQYNLIANQSLGFLVDNGATLNVFLMFIIGKIGLKKSYMMPIDLIMINFCGTIAQPLGVLLIELTTGCKSVETAFFVINVVIRYNMLLGWDWIHASRCIPSSLHQYLITWHGDGSVEVAKTDAKPFVITSKIANVLLYIGDMGTTTFFDCDNEGCRTNYTIT